MFLNVNYDFYSFTNSSFRMFDISHVRKNEDKRSNAYVRRLLDVSKACGLIFLNGRKGSDKDKGSFTFYSRFPL